MLHETMNLYSIELKKDTAHSDLFPTRIFELVQPINSETYVACNNIATEYVEEV
jgi:hypothetical protein